MMKKHLLLLLLTVWTGLGMATVQPDKDTYYFITSQGQDYCRQRVIYNTSRQAGAALRWGDRTLDEHALWRFVPAGDGTYRLQNCATKLYVARYEAGQQLGCITTTGQKKEAGLFRMNTTADGNAVWISYPDGKALHAQQRYNFVVPWDGHADGSASCWSLTPVHKDELAQAAANARISRKGYRPVWNEEFNRDGAPDTTVWNYEQGFVRNHEDQWYQPDNAVQQDGCLMITGRREHKPNPWYEAGSNEWGRQRETIEYTSSSLTTAYKMDFLYGRIEVRAQIPCHSGSWPAIWMHGYRETAGEWPSSGEIDIMEYYRDMTLANVVWASPRRFVGNWESRHVPVTGYWMKRFPGWENQFHTWRMDWDEEAIKLYLDDELITVCALNRTENEGHWHQADNPFRTPQYLMLNLALGGQSGGRIDDSRMPMVYRVDYVRVYQQPRHITGRTCHVERNR
ncbi:MAG: family 16 glycosylhydrolase [Clostridium sp.]|nr:family 16 glycosylhydrolase [Clostridium sp.]